MADKKPEPKWIKKLPRGTFFVIALITFPFWLVIGRIIFGTLAASAILNPYLLLIYIPTFYLIFSTSKNRKNIWQASKNLNKKCQLLVPKNKITRLVLNIGFVVVYYFSIWFGLEFLEDIDIRFTVYAGTPQAYLIDTLVFGGILFFTLFLWLPNGFRDIANTFSKTNKETKRRLKSTAKYLSKSNISDADELKKYADLKDQGIITEEEFQAKKKILLDL